MAADGDVAAVARSLVVAFIWLRGRKKHSSLDLGNRGQVRLVRVKPGAGFRFLHAVHGEIHTEEHAVLSRLCDEGHVFLPQTASLEVLNEFYFRMWIRIAIKKQSAEIVSTVLYREARMCIFLTLSSGESGSEHTFFHRAVERWKKNSKQFPMDEIYSVAWVPPCADVIKADKVHLHQKQALRWMIFREDQPHGISDELPPFWEERNGMYRGCLTCFITFQRPHMLRGGIFADQSGMGKTLSLLCLIAHTLKQTTSSSSDDNVEASKKRKAGEMEECRPTLVVCPPLVLATWKTQVEQFTHPGSLKVCVHRGARSKTRDPSVLSRHDLVLTTYNVVVAEHTSDSPVLNQIHWWRVILDDAHVLKGSTSHATAPFVALKAMRRWAVTGKPVHIDCENYNMYPIFAFLQLQPFCHKLDWDRVINCGPTGGVRSSLETLMEIFSFRRTMPVRSIHNHLVFLSEDEQDLYMSMEVEASKATIRSTRKLEAAVLQLWRSCNSLSLFHLSSAEIISSTNFQDLNGEPELLNKWVTVLQEQKDYACPICLDQPDITVITRCAHLFCTSCIMRLFEKHKDTNSSSCPMCRCLLNKHDIFCPQRGTSVVEKMKYLVCKESSSASKSSKVSALLNLLHKSRTEHPNRKSVVLSQFRRMLMLVGGVLSEAGFDVRYMGVIDNAKTKAKTVKEFCNAEHPVILLTTFHTLSNTSGLDLSAASDVYMMEPCWNVHTEEAALACICRLRNKDDLSVVRLICQDTIEERLLEMRKPERNYGKCNSKREVNIMGFSYDDMLKLLGS